MFAKTNANLLDIHASFEHIFGKALHAKRKLSLTYAALSVFTSESLVLHKMGLGMAEARGVDKKHATKQIDRLLSNPAYDIWDLSAIWVPYIIGAKKEIMVALDWTSFANDSQPQLPQHFLRIKIPVKVAKAV